MSRPTDIRATIQPVPSFTSNQYDQTAQRGRPVSSQYDDFDSDDDFDSYDQYGYRAPSTVNRAPRVPSAYQRPMQYNAEGQLTFGSRVRRSFDRGNDWVRKNPLLTVTFIFGLVILLYTFVRLLRAPRGTR